MSGSDALLRLGSSASSAVAEALERFASGQVKAGDVAVLDSSSSAGDGPLVGLPFPAVASSVRLGDGGGAAVFAMTREGARRLARCMMGAGEPAEDESAADGMADLDDFERGAVSEAMSRMMAAASGSLSEALGREVEIGSPQTQTFETPAAAAKAFAATPHMVRAAFSVAGEPCRLVLMLPVDFVLAMSSVEEGAGAASEASAAIPSVAAAGLPQMGGAAPSLAGIPVRVWAELGRATMPTADVVELPPGAVVELDRGADEPIDLFVNGRRIATGRLMVVDGSDWAVRIETVLHDAGDEPHPA